MKFFFDTEFIDDGKRMRVIPISIGIVSEDGRELHMVSSEFKSSQANDWVKKHVLTKIDKSEIRLSRVAMMKLLLKFVGDEKPEFWAYYSAYDWVIVCQLFGNATNLPEGWSKYCNDLKGLMISKGKRLHPKNHAMRHNALDDARWVKRTHEALTRGQN